MIRGDAGTSTARFRALIGMPERTWRRWQASAHPAWGHRKVWAVTRQDGHRVPQATVLRLLRDEGLILLAQQPAGATHARGAAFAKEPTGPN